MKRLLLIIALLVCLCVPAEASRRPEKSRYTITIDRGSITLPVWKSAKLTRRVTPHTTVKWRSSRPDIVRVTQRGYIVSRKPGRAVITVTTKDGTASAACLVTVMPWTKTGRRVRYNPNDYKIRLAGR